MKVSFLLFALVSFSAFASFNEVECEGKSGNKDLRFEVEMPFPNGSVFKRARLVISENGSEQEYNYTVTSRATRGFQTLRYTAGGLTLEVNHWPDAAPRWGRNYRSELRSSDLESYAPKNMECRFPNAF